MNFPMRLMTRSALAAMLFALALPAFAQAPAPRAGTDYTALPAPIPLYGPPGKIEVAEVFSYHCGTCAVFEPPMAEWKKRQPADVRVSYVHAAFGGAIDNLGRGFFAAEALGASDRTHAGMFKAFHVDRSIRQGTIDEVADAYAAQGLERANVLRTMNSFGVTSRLNRARQFAQRAGVSGTPTVIVNGRYRVNWTPERGADGVLRTIDVLVARERARLRAEATAAAPRAAAAAAARATR